MKALFWKLRFVWALRQFSRRGLSLSYCWMAAEAHLEANEGDVREDAKECAEAEYDACLQCCD